MSEKPGKSPVKPDSEESEEGEDLTEPEPDEDEQPAEVAAGNKQPISAADREEPEESDTDMRFSPAPPTRARPTQEDQLSNSSSPSPSSNAKPSRINQTSAENRFSTAVEASERAETSNSHSEENSPYEIPPDSSSQKNEPGKKMPSKTMKPQKPSEMVRDEPATTTTELPPTASVYYSGVTDDEKEGPDQGRKLDKNSPEVSS